MLVGYRVSQRGSLHVTIVVRSYDGGHWLIYSKWCRHVTSQSIMGNSTAQPKTPDPEIAIISSNSLKEEHNFKILLLGDCNTGCDSMYGYEHVRYFFSPFGGLIGMFFFGSRENINHTPIHWRYVYVFSILVSFGLVYALSGLFRQYVLAFYNSFTIIVQLDITQS